EFSWGSPETRIFGRLKGIDGTKQCEPFRRSAGQIRTPGQNGESRDTNDRSDHGFVAGDGGDEKTKGERRHQSGNERQRNTPEFAEGCAADQKADREDRKEREQDA